jgi:hypothetical protein
MRRLLVLALLLLHSAAWAAGPPARVILIGTYHFSNPGQDQANVESVDVTMPRRQAELQAVTDALAGFKPTFVGVEWPAEAARDNYARYLDGTLPASRNEVVQLGFCLAKQVGLERVHGLDVPGDFPFEPLSAWAQANGKSGDLQALMAQAQGITARITALQTTRSIGGVLREMNTSQALDEAASFYTEFLRYGSGEQQPGVELNARDCCKPSSPATARWCSTGRDTYLSWRPVCGLRRASSLSRRGRFFRPLDWKEGRMG